MSRSKKSPGAKYPGPESPGVKRPGPECQGSETSWAKMKCPGPKRPSPKSQGVNLLEVKHPGSETSRSKNSEGETSWSKMTGLRNVLVQKMQVAKHPGSRSKQSESETSCSKMSGAKRSGPKCPVPGCQKVLRRNFLHDCDTP